MKSRSAVMLLAGLVLSGQPLAAADAAREKLIHSFGNGSDGQAPYTTLIDVNGTLYGTTYYGGKYGYGTVFSLDPKTGPETVLHSFGNSSTDGALPYCGLIDVSGTLYGTTTAGGTYHGTAFKLDPKSGAETVLYSFGNGLDGQSPFAGLIDVKGTLYGTTEAGGTYGHGIAFKLDPNSGAETVLHSFGNGLDGQNPLASLIDVKGMLYGTTYSGGNYGYGIVFSLDPKTGAETVLHSFGNGNDGSQPEAGLINVKGMLYGTTLSGGAFGCGGGNCGTVFAIDPKTGIETVLHSFNYVDGYGPAGNLIDVNGTLYSTTAGGGLYSDGTVFKIDPVNGAESAIYSFRGGAADGWFPFAGLIDVKGTLYGTTIVGGISNAGTVFALKP